MLQLCPNCERFLEISARKRGKIRVDGNLISIFLEIFVNNEIWYRKGGVKMGNIIELTKLDTRKIYINADLIETVEANPDTVIILMSGRKLLVKEKPEEIYKIINSQK